MLMEMKNSSNEIREGEATKLYRSRTEGGNPSHFESPRSDTGLL